MQTFIEQYKIISKIAQGGMAEIYKAYQPSLDRLVAIKKMADSFANQPKLIKRFEQEARVIAKLVHPNIISIYDFKKIDNSYYIIMEFVEGKNLGEYIKLGLPFEIALLVVDKICQALAYAHTEGVIHRDLKPENIIISSRGEVKLMDFGISHFADSTLETTTEAILGTPAYMSPEQARGEEIDLRTDIFSLGILLYTIFVGKHPFEGDSAHIIIHKIIYEPYPSPEEVKSTLPGELRVIIKKCLEKKATARYQNVSEVREALRGMLEELDFGDPEKELQAYVKSPQEYSAKLEQVKIKESLQRGHELKEKKHFIEALTMFKKVLELDSENKEAHLAISQLEKQIVTKRKLLPVMFLCLGIILITGLILIRGKTSLTLPRKDLRREAHKIEELLKEETLPKLKKPDERKTPVKKRLPVPNLAAPKQGKTVVEEKYGEILIFAKPWANIFIGGKLYGRAPTKKPIKLKAGKYILRLESPYVIPLEKEIIIEANKLQTIKFELKKK
jgi:serine/threonine protein kinase